MTPFDNGTIKNPIHRSALNLVGMKKGRRVLLLNIQEGIVGIYTVLGDIRYHTDTDPHIILRSEDDRTTKEYRLRDLGVCPNFDGLWDENQFVIDVTDRHKLPYEWTSQQQASCTANDYGHLYHHSER